MSRIGVISDLHADLPSVESALRHLKAMSVDGIWCAGDLIDLGVFHDEVISLLKSENIPTIRGNHDRWALQRARVLEAPKRKRVDLRRDSFWEPSNISTAYDVEDAEAFGGGYNLSPESVAFLAALPTSLTFPDIEGFRVVMWHGTVGDDMRSVERGDEDNALEKANADVLILGHTHEPRADRSKKRRGFVVNPGTTFPETKRYKRRGALFVPDAAAPSGGTFGVLELKAGAPPEFTVYRVADGVSLG